MIPLRLEPALTAGLRHRAHTPMGFDKDRGVAMPTGLDEWSLFDELLSDASGSESFIHSRKTGEKGGEFGLRTRPACEGRAECRIWFTKSESWRYGVSNIPSPVYCLVGRGDRAFFGVSCEIEGRQRAEALKKYGGGVYVI